MWQGITGHDDVVARFRSAIDRGRLASTYLLVGPRGIGKHSIAMRLAQALLCQERPIERLDPCGVCDSCLQVAARTHPDLLLVAKPADKSFIPLSLLVGDDQRRMREGLCHDIALRPFSGGRKVAVIDDADDLNEEGANALLKTLEEPPPGSVLLLVGTTADKQLPTIRSRSQIMRFRGLDEITIAELLVAQGVVENGADAQRLAALAEGSLSRAVELADDELWAFRDQFLAELARVDRTSVKLAREVNEFVEAAGKDAPSRRRRLRQIMRMAIDFHRQQLRAATTAGDEPERCQLLALLIERSLDGLSQVDRNAHQATLIDCWLDELGQIQAGRGLVDSAADGS